MLIVDEKGYEEYLEEINKLKKEYEKTITSGTDAYNTAVGDGWHDNFDFEESMRIERDIATKIDKMLENVPNIKVIKEEKPNNSIVQIGDTVRIKIDYPKFSDEFLVKITGNYLSNVDVEPMEITLNSPIGNSIYHKRIKDKVKATINNEEVDITIIEKVQ